jgi:2,3-bisphosphoglycerate-dependent phosphoglycerate mutase
MEPTRIIAIRHGETDWNAATRIQGHIDIALNATGQWQARQLALALQSEPLDAIYSSDLGRAYDTALAISQAHPELAGRAPFVRETLRERNFGMFEGKTWAEIETGWPEQSQRWRVRDLDFAPEGGENLRVFEQRIKAITDAIAAQHAGSQIVLVAHGGVMDILYRLATGLSLSASRTWQLGNTAINRLLWSPDGMTLVGWSDVRHLEDGAMDEAHA